MSTATSESDEFITDTDWVERLKKRGASDDPLKERRWGSLEASLPFDADAPILYLPLESDCGSYMVVFDQATGEPSIVPGNNDRHYRFERSPEGFSFRKSLKNGTTVDQELRDGDEIKLGGYKYTFRKCDGAFQKYEIVPGSAVKRGSSGKVVTVRVIGEPKPQYAVKIIPGHSRSADKWDTYEISTLKALSHPNISRLVEAFLTADQSLHLVMEYIPNTLKKYLSSPSAFLPYASPYPPDVFGGSLLLQICSATEYIHSLGIIHRDITPENILVLPTSPLHLKLADFGQAVRSDPTPTQKDFGTLEYMAPEGVAVDKNAEKKYDKSVDYYSVGVVFFEILMVAVNDYSNGDIRKLPEVAKARRISNAAYVNALAEARMGLLENLGSEQSTVHELARGLLEHNPSDRFSMSVALAHPWLALMKAKLATPLDAIRSRSPTPYESPVRPAKKARTANNAIATAEPPESSHSAHNLHGTQASGTVPEEVDLFERGSSPNQRLPQKRKSPY